MVYEALTSIQIAHLTGGTRTCCLQLHTLLKLLKDKKGTEGPHKSQELRAENRLGPTLLYNIKTDLHISFTESLPPSSQEIGGNFSGELPKTAGCPHMTITLWWRLPKARRLHPHAQRFSSVSRCLKLKYYILKHLLRKLLCTRGTILAPGNTAVNKTKSVSLKELTF